MKNQPSGLSAPFSIGANDTAGLVLDNLPEAVLLLDSALNILSCNRAAKEELWQKVEINVTTGMPALLLLPSQYREFAKTIAQEVLDGKTRIIETRHLFESEPVQIYENSFSPARNGEGAIIGLLIRSTNITQQKNNEKTTQEAEERWQFAFEASGQAAWEWNMQTDEVIYSSSYKKLYGFSGDELKNNLSEWQNRIHPEDRQRIQQAVQAHSHSENPYHETTYRIQLKNGDYKWVMARGKLLSKDSNGRPLRMIGTHTDLTETLQSRAEIDKMNERFHYAAKASSQALWEWDALTGEAYASPSFTEMFGWKVDENKHFEQWHFYVHPDDREATVGGYYDTLRDSTDTIWQATYRFLKADGAYACVNDKAYILRNEEGEAIKVIGATQDVTALKKAEEDLAKSNERYEMLRRATNELLWEWNLQTDEIDTSKEGASKVYGIGNHAEIKSIPLWTDRVHPDDLNRMGQHLQAVRCGQHLETFEAEYRFRRDDGSYNDIHSRAIVLRDGHGAAVRAIGSEENISERKRLERELLQHELEMKKRINQATVDSQEQERTEIGRELHDNINQVLTTTKLYVELALAESDGQKELLEKAAGNISRVISEIRQLSRSLMDPTIGDLGIIHSINDLVENLNLTRKVRISLQIDEAIEESLNRKQKLTVFRIIQEALNNVIRHAHATTVAIAIHQQGENIAVEIRDDGRGFPAASVKKGAGLKNIINRVYLINGTFTVESHPGKGCAVQIHFPLKEALKA